MMLSEVRKRAVRDTVRKLFPGEVESVRLTDELDGDGDRILKVTIVLKKNTQLRDRRKMIGLARNLRKKIKDDSVFPLIDFISARDAAKQKRAAA
jgi:hypothetical protein